MKQSTGAFRESINIRGLMTPIADEAGIIGSDPFFCPLSCIGETVAALLAATPVAANDLWEQRTGRRQRVAISVREASASLHVID